MSVRVRLRRMGNRNNPFFRIVVADGPNAATGRFVESLGWYDPKRAGINFKLNKERVDYWRRNGAVFSPTVLSLVQKSRRLPEEPEAAPAEMEPKVAAAEAGPLSVPDEANPEAAADEPSTSSE